MRLRTELTNEQPFGRHVEWKKTGDLFHDAALAHALVMACSEAKDTHCCSYREYDEFLKERTAEIMAEWGHGED